MDTDMVRDMASLDPELLQLPEVSQLALKEKPKIAEDLYCQWLSLPETRKLVRFLYLLCPVTVNSTQLVLFTLLLTFCAKWWDA